MFGFGSRTPRRITPSNRLISEKHERPNCTITFLKDPRDRIRHVIVQLPGRKAVRVTPEQYKKWREIAVSAKGKTRGNRQGISGLAMSVAITHPGAFGRLLHAGKSMGGDVLQAIIDVAMN